MSKLPNWFKGPASFLLGIAIALTVAEVTAAVHGHSLGLNPDRCDPTHYITQANAATH